MVIDHQYQHLSIIRYYGDIASQPLYYLSELPASISKYTYEYFRDRNTLIEEKKALYKKNLQLSSRITQSLEIENENRILRDLLKSTRKEIRHSAITAEMIGVHPIPLEQKIIVDKGSTDNVYINQPALDSDGIIGQVSKITPYNSTITLISSPGHSILGEIKRSSIRVLVIGIGNPERLQLNYVPVNSDIKVGDKVFSSSLENRFPAGYPIATITDVIQETGDVFATIYAKPVSRLGYNRQILLINNKSQNSNKDNGK